METDLARIKTKSGYNFVDFCDTLLDAFAEAEIIKRPTMFCDLINYH